MLVEHGLGADPAQRDLVLEVAAARVAALGAGERRAALGGVVAALGDRAPGAAAALARALAADLARPARLEAVAEMLADGAEARDPGAVVQVCLAAISGPGPAGPSEDRFAPRPGAPLPRGLLAACGRAAARPGVAPEDGARLLKAVLLGARDCLGAQEEQTLSSVLLDLARSGSVPPPVAADLCEMLRCLGQFTAENTLKRLRFGIFGPAPGARESPNGEGLASFPPAHACAMLLLASVAAGADVGELAPLLEDSFAVQDSGLHVLAATYSPADVDRAAAFLAAKAVEVPLFWTMVPESRSVYRLLDLQPEHGYRALAAPGPLTENGNDHAQDTKGEAARSRPEAERLRLLYQGADLYPDELALAALPSGSFSAVTRMKSTELQRQNSALEVALRG
ncbi:hypothetical protein QBZ16_002867 [Prototheca wickerhamii]|uniref:Uncharacterized protein n=1 Tax=Prototheca wickerhamii TaxID=3111 RepID=A0AAD9IIP9_PROWI|nr:hypothetical protein QBZ16_002867 [Prototheca wickerhamii]